MGRKESKRLKEIQKRFEEHPNWKLEVVEKDDPRMMCVTDLARNANNPERCKEIERRYKEKYGKDEGD